ncbi:MAG: ABC transporter ATP-binding protein [archaeon]|nr:ABC transporter ATP-binding protein [archaeon]
MPKDPDSIIRAENVFKIYEMGETKVFALNGVSFDLRKGEYVTIMGPSGSGKTTLLDVLSVLLRPTKGEVFIKGKPISKMPDDELAQIRGKTIGFVFQTFNLIPRYTAKQNVMLPLWFEGIEKSEREKIAEQVLKDVGLGDRINFKPNQMSGGQRQRVAIARALAVNPDVIVADEPTGNLDSESGNHVLDIIDELHNKGKTILMVTHERDVGERAEKIIHIKDGKIIENEVNGKAKKRNN